MKSDKDILNTIISEFPHQRKEISILYFQSSSFIEICEDYFLCLNSIKKIEAIEKSANNKKLNDLKLALIQLKEELLSKI